VKTAQNSAVAALTPAEIRGSAFGLMAGIRAFRNLGASAVAGIIWAAVSPSAAFGYLAVWMMIASPSSVWPSGLVNHFGSLPTFTPYLTP